MSIDLSAFETQEEGAWLDVLHPVTGAVLRDESGEAMRICLVGKDSKEFRKAQRAATQRRLRSRSKANRIDAESVELDAIEMLVACTKDWTGIGDNGAPLEFTPANVRAVYTRYVWLREQVDEFVDDRGNFIQG